MVIAKSLRQKEILESYRETFPIRTPGAIQPYGALLAVNPGTFIVEQVSQNVRTYIGKSPKQLLGRPLRRVLSENQILKLKAAIASESEGLNWFQLTLSVKGKPAHFDVAVHQIQGVVIIELEPKIALSSERILFDSRVRIEKILSRLQQVKNISDFLSLVAQEIQNLTGFDRVMVYRFDGDSAGVVEAESKVENLSPYLGLRFPSTDVPALARALFQDNPVRLIPNVNYEPVPIVTAQAADSQASSEVAAGLDMGNTILRQASPCHMQYLKNMGVAATMTLPLIKDQKVWGMIACHHQTPKRLPYEVRATCEFLGRVIGLELTSKVNYADLVYQKHLQTLLSDFIEAIAQAPDLKTALIDPGPLLSQMVGAEGVAVCLEGEISLIGETPELAQVHELMSWANSRVDGNIYYTEMLAEQYPPAESFRKTASGVLLLQVSQVRQYSILWFRPEVIQTVAWAGDPCAGVNTSEDGTIELTPRRSFEIWQETVHYCSLPWRKCEVDTALELRNSLVGIILNKADELAQFNLELQRSNRELDFFAYAASHDLQEPLRGIYNYANLVMQDSAEAIDPIGRDRLSTMMGLTQRMQSLIDGLLHFSRLGQAELQPKQINLDQMLKRVVQLLKVSRKETEFELRLPRPLPVVNADPVLIEELFSNLISNAIKYNSESSKWVEIGYWTSEEANYPATHKKFSLAAQVVFYVKDNGIGIRERHLDKIFRLFKQLHARDKYGSGTGVGLTITQKIIERHGGHIWVESVYGEGTAFYFTLGQ